MALLETLKDDFNDNSLSAAWSDETSGATITESNSKIECVVTGDGGYSFIYSVSDYSLVGSYAAAKIDSAGTQSSGNWFTPIRIFLSWINNDYLNWYVHDGNIYAAWDYDGDSGTVFSATYNASVHKYVRIREEGGYIYWDYSSNNLIWTNAASLASPFSVSTIYVELAEIYSSGTGYTASLDDFNLRDSFEIDYMEYATDAAAQAAYVTDSVPSTINVALASSGGVCTTSGTWYLDNPSIFNDGDRVYGQLASVGTTPWAEIEFTGSSHINSVVASCAAGASSSFAWKVYAYYGSSWNEIGTGSTSGAQADYTYNTGWSGVTKIKFEVTSSGGSIGGVLYEFEAFGYLDSAVKLQSYSESTIKSQGSYSLKGVAAAGNISNADILDEDMSDISEWYDADAGGGVSSQVTFDGVSCMKLDSGPTPPSDAAQRYVDVGTFEDVTVFSMKLYFDSIGTYENEDFFIFAAYDGTNGLAVRFASNNLYVMDSSVTYQAIGTNPIVQDVWQEWTFCVTWEASASVDIYLNDVLFASSVNCAWDIALPNGIIAFLQSGHTSSNMITYVDWIKVGTGMSGGSLNKTLTRTFS